MTIGKAVGHSGATGVANDVLRTKKSRSHASAMTMKLLQTPEKSVWKIHNAACSCTHAGATNYDSRIS